MKLTSLFHLSLMTLAVGLTADLAAAATVQPKDQSSASASAQATSGETATESNKNAHTDSNAQASLPQEALTSGATGQDSPHKPKVAEQDHAPSNRSNTATQAISTQAAPAPAVTVQPNTQSSSSAQAPSGETATESNKNTHTDSNAQASLPQEALPSGATGQDSPHKLKVAVKDHAPSNQSNTAAQAAPAQAPAPAATVQPSTQNSASTEADAKEARADQTVTGSAPQPLCLKFSVLNDSPSRLTFNKEESFFMLAHLLDTGNIENLRKLAAQTNKISVNKDKFGAILIVKVSEEAETTKAVRDNIGIGIDKRFRSSEGNQIWHTAYMQAVKNKEIQPQAGRDLLAAVFPPAPAPAAPAQPKSIFTRAFRTHPWVCSGVCVLVGAATMYGGYRLYKHVNMRKLARYAGNWA